MEKIFSIFLLYSSYSYVVIFIVLVLSGVGLAVPEELMVMLSGFIIARGIVRPGPMIVFCIFGVFFSDLSAFLLGHFYGQSIKEQKLVGQLFNFRRMRKVEKYSKLLGNWLIFFGRFATGIRPLVFLVAGISKLNLIRFIVIDFIGSIISVVIWAGAGWFLSRHIEILLIYLYGIKNFIIYSIAFFVLVYLLDKFLIKKQIKFFPPSKLRKLQISMVLSALIIVLGIAWQTVTYRLYLIRYLPGSKITTIYIPDEVREIAGKFTVSEPGQALESRANIVFTGRMVDLDDILKRCG
jgi:membrane protein DedA with SNARE-associated domain